MGENGKLIATMKSGNCVDVRMLIADCFVVRLTMMCEMPQKVLAKPLLGRLTIDLPKSWFKWCSAKMTELCLVKKVVRVWV